MVDIYRAAKRWSFRLDIGKQRGDTLFRFINTLVQFCGEHADSVSCRFCVLDLLLSDSFPNIRMRRRVCKWQAARLNFQFDKVKEETR